MPHSHHHIIANILHLIAGGALGLIAAALAQHFGSRSADRLPGESRMPECPFCLKPFTWQEISPLFGWLLRPDTLAFPCACTKRKGMWMQPTAEILGLGLGILAMFLAGWTPMALPLCLGLGLLPAIAIIDLEYGVIPDGLNLFVAFFGFWWMEASGGDGFIALIVAASLLAVGLFCALVYSRWRKQEMLGLGDVKFFAAAGLWLQPQIAPWFLALAGIVGAVMGFIWERAGGGKEFPFGPALCLSLALFVLYQLTQMP